MARSSTAENVVDMPETAEGAPTGKTRKKASGPRVRKPAVALCFFKLYNADGSEIDTTGMKLKQDGDVQANYQDYILKAHFGEVERDARLSAVVKIPGASPSTPETPAA